MGERLDSVETSNGTPVAGEKMLASHLALALESWKMSTLLLTVVSQLDVSESQKYLARARYFRKRISESLDDVGLRLVHLDGQPFDSGMAATALNLEDFDPTDELLVDIVIEPLVMGPRGVLHPAIVSLRKELP
jgi:hypothetical protein